MERTWALGVESYFSDVFFSMARSGTTSSLSWAWSSVKELLLVCAFIGVVFSACPQGGKYCLEWGGSVALGSRGYLYEAGNWSFYCRGIFVLSMCGLCVCVHLHVCTHTHNEFFIYFWENLQEGYSECLFSECLWLSSLFDCGCPVHLSTWLRWASWRMWVFRDGVGRLWKTFKGRS